MAHRIGTRRPVALVVLPLAVLAAGCGHPGSQDVPLQKVEEEGIPNVPVPAADGPKLGAIANVTPIFERPSKDAKQLGYVHAGGTLARATQAYGTTGCPGGWYPVRPRGFICAGETATTELGHPTLVAMAIQPKLDQPLPYTYARTRQETSLYERDPARENGVREVGKIGARSGLAVVGSWSAQDPEGREQRLALMTNGRFVKASDLEAAEGSTFQGVTLDDKVTLPMSFVVKRGVRYWNITDGEAEKKAEVDYHAVIPLTGKFRDVDGLRYWATVDGKYVRLKDVTVVRKRDKFPDFATGTTRWIDISVLTNTLVLYEGRRPVFTTLVSTGHDRLGDPKTSASTALGSFPIVGKHITAAGVDPKAIGESLFAFDAPWVLELGSGQLLHGAYWHSRFGIENGPGHVQLSPSDALRVFQWVEPGIPDGWHGVSSIPQDAQPVTVLIRK